MALSWPALRHLLPAVQEMQKLSGCTFQMRMAWIGTYHTIFVVYHIWGYEHPAIYIYTSYFGMNTQVFHWITFQNLKVLASFVCFVCRYLAEWQQASKDAYWQRKSGKTVLSVLICHSHHSPSLRTKIFFWTWGFRSQIRYMMLRRCIYIILFNCNYTPESQQTSMFRCATGKGALTL